MKHFCGLLTVLLWSSVALANDVFPHEFKINVLSTQINVGTFAPRESDMATVVYLHGFSDTMNNHEELLSQLHDGGMRVISFDYPSHGKSEGNIWFWSILDVARLIREILNHSQFRAGELSIDPKLPLILVGWSTGATIAVRTAQTWSDRVIPTDLKLAGIVGIGPGVPARALVGNGISRLGIKVKVEDLTRTPRSVKYPPKPDTTVPGAGFFAGTLKAESEVAYWKGSTKIPTLMIIADNDKDYFAQAESSAYWVRTAGRSVPTFGFQCDGAYHGLEFEPDGIGEFTRLATIEFAQRLSRNPGENIRRSLEAGFRHRNFGICRSVHQR